VREALVAGWSINVTSFHLLIHIGYQKTGSTWLQRELFTHPELGFFPLVKNGCGIEPGSKQTKQGGSPFLFPPDFAFNGSQVREKLRKEMQWNENRMNVISSEALSGHASVGYTNAAEIADRLYQVFPEAKILVGVREQASMISSLYHQYLKMGGTLSLAASLARSEDLPFPGSISLERFHYDRLIAHYKRLFGEERVMAYPLERWKEDFAGFLEEFGAFLGLRIHAEQLPTSRLHNRSEGLLAAKWLRRLSPLIFCTAYNGFSPYGHYKSFYDAEWIRRLLDRLIPASIERRHRERNLAWIRNRIGDRYAESNRTLAGQIGFPLDGLGYLL
jgi:hypothetical protein